MGVNFLQALTAPEYCKALEQSDALALNRIGYCENKFVLPLDKVLDTGERVERRTPAPNCLVQQFFFCMYNRKIHIFLLVNKM